MKVQMYINKEVYLLQAIIVTNKNTKKEDYLVLQLQTKKIDICRISKLLVRYNIKASITNQVVTLEGDISDELLIQLCNNIEINIIQNYISEEKQFDVHGEATFSKSETTILSESVEEFEASTEVIVNETVEESETAEEVIQSETVEVVEESTELIPKETVEEEKITTSIEEYQLIYPVVKRGQVYWCDLDFDSGVNEKTGEDCKRRPVIIVSNDIMNMDPKCKYVKIIPCSTISSKCPWDYHFRFTDEIMIEKVEETIGNRYNSANGELSKPVNKNRLIEYIGTMTPEFMDKIQEIIDVAYDLKREVKTIVKKETVYVDRPIPKKTVVNKPSKKQIEEANKINAQLLSYIDNDKLQEILQSKDLIQIKAQRILELYGFDLEKNGVPYLLKAINISTQQSYFNLETLSEKVSKKVGVAKEEVMRLIVARVKEKFSFKNAPTIEFIRLINSLLLKQGEEK